MVKAAGHIAPWRDRRVRSDWIASLSSLDLCLLRIVSEHRIVTQTQLELVLRDVPARTLRYRTARLQRLGLVGRTRPYRERGSAPYHLWPTRRGDALARGGPPSRGGERREPNATFIAHAAALTGFYVALATGLSDGVRHGSFAREGEAREPFRARDGRQRAIAPDARIELEQQDGCRLVGLLEIDLGTMSHRRLRSKARGYADYARARAWAERHEFCPALLFATITPRRAIAFLDSLSRELERESELLGCACAFAREPEHAVAERVWHLLGAGGPVDLVEALREARRPYDEQQARCAELRRREHAARERLLSDPAALRSHLRRQRCALPERLDGPARTAVKLLLEEGDELAEPERRVLRTLGAMLADPLVGRWADRDPQKEEREALSHLVDHYRSRQLKAIGELERALGDGPALRGARARLRNGELVSSDELRWVRSDAERDREIRTRQEELRSAYLERREREARALAKQQGLAARLRQRPADLLADVDRRLLRVCPRCDEVVYPGSAGETSWTRGEESARICPYCDGRGLEPWDERDELASGRGA